MKKLPFLTTLAVSTIVFAACGDDDDSGTPATTAAPASSEGGPGGSTAGTADFNDADVEFAQGMIAHHEQAVEMAEIALDPTRAASPEVVDLATRIQGAQDPEIQLMTSWLAEWDRPLVMDTSDGHDMESMDGMMSAEEMDELATLTGADFDTMWMEMMIRHHEGAITQSEEIRTAGSNADVLALADQIIAAQQGEIAEMQQLLAA